jgi:hypothetical protein
MSLSAQINFWLIARANATLPFKKQTAGDIAKNMGQ